MPHSTLREAVGTEKEEGLPLPPELPTPFWGQNRADRAEGEPESWRCPPQGWQRPVLCASA